MTSAGGGAWSLTECADWAAAHGFDCVRLNDSGALDSDHILAQGPGHVIPCIPAVPDNSPRGTWASVMGSIFPAVWSFNLALRARGLGTVLTTLHLGYEQEAAELLGIPSHIMQVGLLPVAYTKGTKFKPAERKPLEDIVHWESW